MKITKTVTHLIHMGEYESLTVGVTVEVDVPEGITRDKALDDIDVLVNDALEPELKEARRSADYTDCKSYIRDWRN